VRAEAADEQPSHRAGHRRPGTDQALRRRRGVDDVSFAVRSAEIYTLLGRNGAGKTTTIRMLVGLSRADQGFALRLV
jgi:ABC-type multidrug transport system ATPase subunit